MSNMTLPRFVGFSGSLRKGSYTTAVVETLKSALADKISLDTFSLEGIPLYNADLEEEGVPDQVEIIKEAIQKASGVIIVTPEYNSSVPGVLKNALDWLSRPAYNSPIKHKPVLAISASPGAMGGVRAQAHLRDILFGMLAKPAPVPEVVISAVHTKIVDGRLTDEPTLKRIRDSLDVVLRECCAGK